MSEAPSATVASPDILNSNPEKRCELEKYIDSLPPAESPERRRGYLIQSLHRAQEIFGYLPEPVQILIAQRLGLHLSEVFGVISFYSYFTTSPVGKYKINVCTGTACFVRGAGAILDEFRQALGVAEGGTTPDLKFTLGGLRCVGACSLAPVVMVNEKVYGNVKSEQVRSILQSCP